MWVLTLKMYHCRRLSPLCWECSPLLFNSSPVYLVNIDTNCQGRGKELSPFSTLGNLLPAWKIYFVKNYLSFCAMFGWHKPTITHLMLPYLELVNLNHKFSMAPINILYFQFICIAAIMVYYQIANTKRKNCTCCLISFILFDN